MVHLFFRQRKQHGLVVLQEGVQHAVRGLAHIKQRQHIGLAIVGHAVQTRPVATLKFIAVRLAKQIKIGEAVVRQTVGAFAALETAQGLVDRALV